MRTRVTILLHLEVLSCAWLALTQEELGPLRKDNLERWVKEVRSASTTEELLMLMDFSEWKLWRCRLRLGHARPSHYLDSRLASTGSHRATRYAATSYSLEILKAIDDEWEKTQCKPREVCVNVAQELNSDLDVFFKPPCISAFRCAGCCNQDESSCRNTSSTYVNKAVFTVIHAIHKLEPVLIRVANHTECTCSRQPPIRRHTSSNPGDG